MANGRLLMANSKWQIEAKIIKHIKVAPNYFKLLLDASAIAKAARPGQFIQVKVSDDYLPLLRRPLSIHRAHGSKIEFLYEKLGQGTELLSKRKVGEYLDIIGPLGNGFDCPQPATRNPQPILIAGGMGVAPLLFLAEKLMELKNKNAKRKIIVLIGTKTESHLLCERELKALGCDVRVATDDGSKGFRGRVTELLESILGGMSDERRTTRIYACGPKPMLREITSMSKEYNITAQVSLEAHMACGIGACLGCVIKTCSGYKRACKEGPVFYAQDVVW